MKKYCIIVLSTLVLASSAMAVVTNSLQIGGEGTPNDWSDNVMTNSGVSPTEYSVTFGVPYRYTFTEISNVTFTVSFTETNGLPVVARLAWICATSPGDTNDRLNTNEVMRLKVSYSDPDNKLMGFRLSGIGTTWNTQPYETMVFSDGVNSTSLTETANDTIFDYEALGLNPLSTNNVDTWELLIGVDDTVGGGTNFTEAGVGAFQLEYIVDTDEVPLYDALTPAFFDFVDNGGTGDFDQQGPGATMTRSNGWDSAITITTVDIIGQDGSSATNGTGNTTSIQGNSIQSLGVNSADNIWGVGTESRDFNPNEAWIISFDKDVFLVEVDLASVVVDTEMTIFSDVFPSNFVMYGEGDDNTDGTWDLLDTFVPAGTTLKFQMTSTTNSSTDWKIRMDDLTVQLVSDTRTYDAWVQDQNLVAIIDDYGDDPDKDTLDNLTEFALGGDPLVKDAETILPVYGQSVEGGTNWLNYIYRRRIYYDDAGLTYLVGSTVDLISGPVTNVTEEADSVVVNADIESVTNRVSMDVESEQFMQLHVTID